MHMADASLREASVHDGDETNVLHAYVVDANAPMERIREEIKRMEVEGGGPQFLSRGVPRQVRVSRLRTLVCMP